jgi:hypothetical protein
VYKTVAIVLRWLALSKEPADQDFQQAVSLNSLHLRVAGDKVPTGKEHGDKTMSDQTQKTTGSPSTTIIRAKTAKLVEASKKGQLRSEEAPARAGVLKTAPSITAQSPVAESAAPTKSLAATTQSPMPSLVQNRARSAGGPVEVSFAIMRPGAKRVSVCGDFNRWSPSETPLKRHEDGHWETTVALSPGKYQYKFLVDGEWIHDLAAQNTVCNQYGSLNSVVEVRV